MSEPTKGEWVARKASNGDIGIVVEEGQLVLAECFVAIRGPFERATAECEANARLMVNAKKMADALMKVLAAGHDGDEPDYDEVEATLRAAGVMP